MLKEVTQSAQDSKLRKTMINGYFTVKCQRPNGAVPLKRIVFNEVVKR